jgi:hypothetical protein
MALDELHYGIHLGYILREMALITASLDIGQTSTLEYRFVG